MICILYFEETSVVVETNTCMYTYIVKISFAAKTVGSLASSMSFNRRHFTPGVPAPVNRRSCCTRKSIPGSMISLVPY